MSSQYLSSPFIIDSINHLVTNDQEVPVFGRDVRGPWLIWWLVHTGVVGAAITFTLDELVDGQAEIKLLLAADANIAVASLLLDIFGIAALVAHALGLAPDVQHPVGVPDLMAQGRTLRGVVGPGAGHGRRILSAAVHEMVISSCPILADAPCPLQGPRCSSGPSGTQCLV
ncbi:hypothetical protein GJ744_000910 [Endocarpon pusillum]|uniref:Uncharacterized protein n=1 Tax=Endocarpon pusillum TaxID=364733 RepID=A0A8H7E6X2_9EURO|nr:hypothetical protein GJ744_000910 [Endocarpon pusillum]